MIYFIMPVFNRIDKTKECIDSIKASNFDEDYKVLLIDDGSTDGTFNYFFNHPKIIILRGNGNLFWGGAVNLGMGFVKLIGKPGDSIALINNDVILDKDCLQNILSNPYGSIYSAISVTDGLIINSGARKIKNKFINFYEHLYKGKDYSSVPNKLMPIDVFTARLLIFPFESLFIINKIPTRFLPHYGGDDYLSYQFKINNYNIYLCTSAVVNVKPNDKLHVNNFFSAFCFNLLSVRSSINIKKMVSISFFVSNIVNIVPNLCLSIFKSIFLSLMRSFK